MFPLPGIVQNNRHRLRMDGGHVGTSFCRQECEQVISGFAVLDLAHRPPSWDEDTGEEAWPVVSRAEPGVAAERVRFCKGGERHKASKLGAKPAPPVRRFRVADVGHASVRLFANVHRAKSVRNTLLSVAITSIKYIRLIDAEQCEREL